MERIKEECTTRDIQLKLLHILTEVDKVCKEQNITYYLIAGTLLGAVRHRGFIPWDDDMDIAMPRKDYERFIKIAGNFLPEYIEVKYYTKDPDYFLPLSKIEDARTTLVYGKHLKYTGGMGIDLFPLDGVPENRIRRKIHFWQIALYNRIRYFVYRDPFKHGHGISSWPSRLVRTFFSGEQVQNKLELLKKSCDYETSEWVCDHDEGDVTLMPKAYIGKPVPVLFEGKLFSGVEKADAYLTAVYGDYMQLPSEKDRKQKQHHYYHMDLNRSYKDRK